jgi:hypothetical protein
MRRIACAVLAGLVSTAPTFAQVKQDPDAREIAAYRLSMEAVNKVAAATRVTIAELKKDPRYQEAAQLDAQIKAIQKKEETTPADDAKLEQLEARKDAVSESLQGLSMDNAASLSDMEAQLRKVPAMMAGLRAANLSPREYATFMLSALQAGMVAGLKKQGALKAVPKDVPEENVKFIEEHEAELQALQKEWAALGDGEK